MVSRSRMALAVTLAVVLTACSADGSTSDSEVFDAGAGVIVEAPGFDGKIVAEEIEVPESLAEFDVVGATVEITAKPAELPATATVEMPASGADDGQAVIVVTSEDPDGPWRPVEVTVSDGRARFEVEHFSFFSLLRVSREFLERVVREVFEGFTAEVFTSAEQPRCVDEEGARSEGWSITSNGPETLKWCFGRDDEGRFVHVANNRRYPLALATPSGTWTFDSSGPRLSLEVLSEAAQTRWAGAAAILVSQETTTFRIIEIAEGGSGRIRTEYDGLTHVVGSIQYAAEAFVAILSRFGLVPIRGGANALVAGLVGARPCLDAILTGDGVASVSSVISKCFDAGVLSELVGGGVAGVIAGLAVAVGGFIGFLAQSASALVDQFTGRDAYSITVTPEEPPADPAPLGGAGLTWPVATSDPEEFLNAFGAAWISGVGGALSPFVPSEYLDAIDEPVPGDDQWRLNWDDSCLQGSSGAGGCTAIASGRSGGFYGTIWFISYTVQNGYLAVIEVQFRGDTG